MSSLSQEQLHSEATGSSAAQQAELSRLRQGLLAGWEVGMTPAGRVYYIDHNTRRTAWERPLFKPSAEDRDDQPVEQQAQSQVGQPGMLPSLNTMKQQQGMQQQQHGVTTSDHRHQMTLLEQRMRDENRRMMMANVSTGISPLPPQFNQTSIPQQAQSQVGQPGMPPHQVMPQQQPNIRTPMSMYPQSQQPMQQSQQQQQIQVLANYFTPQQKKQFGSLSTEQKRMMMLEARQRMVQHMQQVRLSQQQPQRSLISPLPPQLNQTSIPQQAQSQSQQPMQQQQQIQVLANYFTPQQKKQFDSLSTEQKRMAVLEARQRMAHHMQQIRMSQQQQQPQHQPQKISRQHQMMNPSAAQQSTHSSSTQPPSSESGAPPTSPESVNPDAAHEALDQTITVTTTNLVVSGSPGSGKTSVVSLSVGEPAPTVRNSTGCVEKPVRAIAHGAMHARGTKLQKLEGKAFLRMINQAMRHEIEKTMRSRHASRVATTSGNPPPCKQRRQEVQHPAAEHSEPAAAEEDIKVFAKLLEEVFSTDSSPDFLTAHLVLTIDSGGQPNFMDAAHLFLRNNSLYLLTIKLNERLDEKPKFDFYINGKPISMCNTDVQLTNLQLVECLAKNVSSVQLTTPNTEDGAEPRQAKFMIVGTFCDKASECCDETIADKNRILRDRLKDCESDRIDEGEDVILAVNAITSDPEEREKAALRLQEKITTTPGTTIKTKIKLRWFGLLLHLLDEAEKKSLSILSLSEVLAAAKSLKMSEQETRLALKFFHELNLIMHYPTKKLDHLVIVDVNPVLELVSHLIGVSFIDKHMLDEIFKPNLPTDAQKKLRDYGRFSRDILDSSFPFSASFTADVFLDLLEHISVVARIVKAGQTSYFLPCALPYAPERILRDKEQNCTNSWSVRLKIRRETIQVVVPIPKGYVPTLAVCLLNSTEFEADTTNPQYRDIMCLCYSAGSHVYLIERDHQVEINYSGAELLPEQCSIIRSKIMAALVEVEEKLHFVPDILTKEDMFVCSCNEPCRHFCTYNPHSNIIVCERTKKPHTLDQQQQHWIQFPVEGTSELNTAAAATQLPTATADLSRTFSTPLTMKQLVTACKRVTDWHTLGIQLDLTTSQLDNIHVTYHVQGVVRLKTAMFDAWLKSSPSASWADLITALENMDEHRVASDIIAASTPAGSQGRQNRSRRSRKRKTCRTSTYSKV